MAKAVEINPGFPFFCKGPDPEHPEAPYIEAEIYLTVGREEAEGPLTRAIVCEFLEEDGSPIPRCTLFSKLGVEPRPDSHTDSPLFLFIQRGPIVDVPTNLILNRWDTKQGDVNLDRRFPPCRLVAQLTV